MPRCHKLARGLDSHTKKEGTMSVDNKALVRRFHDEVIIGGNLGTVDDLCSPDLVDHAAPPGVPGGIEQAKQVIGMYRTAFPGLALTVEDMIAEGDRVACRFTAAGTHQGDLVGIAPTGKRLTLTGMEFRRIAGVKLVEHWESFDQLGMMQQLGVVPPMGEGEA